MDERRRTNIRSLIENHTRIVKAGTPAEAREDLERESRFRNGGIFQEVGPRGTSMGRDTDTARRLSASGDRWKPVSQDSDRLTRK